MELIFLAFNPSRSSRRSVPVETFFQATSQVCSGTDDEVCAFVFRVYDPLGSGFLERARVVKVLGQVFSKFEKRVDKAVGGVLSALFAQASTATDTEDSAEVDIDR